MLEHHCLTFPPWTTDTLFNVQEKHICCSVQRENQAKHLKSQVLHSTDCTDTFSALKKMYKTGSDLYILSAMQEPSVQITKSSKSCKK